MKGLTYNRRRFTKGYRHLAQQGFFLTLEGSEGVGKTTNLAFVERYLKAHDKEVVVTREPGGTDLAESIRGVLLAHHQEKVAQDTELLLMFASRAQHIDQVIRPALAEGKVVICSRFTDSTYAYQGGGRGIAHERIAVLEKWCHEDLQPDLTLLFDLPVEVGKQRIDQRAELDRIEQQELDFFQRVRDAYLQRAKGQKRFEIIDASLPLDTVQQHIKDVLSRWVLS